MRKAESIELSKEKTDLVLNDAREAIPDKQIAEKHNIDLRLLRTLKKKHNLDERSLLIKIKQLEKENTLFKRLFNELSLENALLKADVK